MNFQNYIDAKRDYNQEIAMILAKPPSKRGRLQYNNQSYLASYPFYSEQAQNLPKVKWLEGLIDYNLQALSPRQKGTLAHLYASEFWAPEVSPMLNHRLNQVSLIVKTVCETPRQPLSIVLPCLHDYCDRVAERQNHLHQDLIKMADLPETDRLNSLAKVVLDFSSQELFPFYNQVDSTIFEIEKTNLSKKQIQLLSSVKNCIMGGGYSDRINLRNILKINREVPSSFRISEFRHKKALSLTQRI